MGQNGRRLLGQVIFRGRFLYLLFFILMMIALKPLDEFIGKFGILLDLIITAILLSAIYAISQKRNFRIIGVLLAVPMLLSVWFTHFFKITWLQISGNLFGIAFFAFIIITILSFIFSQDEITIDQIAGAAVVYLLMATMWIYAYRVIEMIHPGSFYIAQGHSTGQPLSFMYYSFVTITTLGYGDIFPISTAAKSCAILEAVIGQLYLVSTVAWLVGANISQAIRKKYL